MPEANLHILIPYWHGAQVLPRCIEHILDSEDIDLKSIHLCIVRNGGELPSLQDQIQTEVLSVAENIGFGRAVNIGLQYLRNKAEYILVLNQDCFLHPKCLAKLIQAVRRQPAFYTPIIKDDTFGTIAPWYRDKYYADVDLTATSPQPVTLMSAACVMAPAGTFTSAGYFDPAFPMYYEDDDYFTRYVLSGGDLYVITAAIAGHSGGSTESHNPLHVRQKRSGYLMFLLRHRNMVKVRKRMFRHYLSCIARIRVKKLFQFIADDLHMLREKAYLQSATHSAINQRAEACISADTAQVQ